MVCRFLMKDQEKPEAWAWEMGALLSSRRLVQEPPVYFEILKLKVF